MSIKVVKGHVSIDGAMDDDSSENGVDAGCETAPRSDNHVEGNCSAS